MGIFIVTQSIDEKDSVLSFFLDWVNEFARHTNVIVVANKVGSHHLPKHVQVFSLGGEQNSWRITKVMRLQYLFLRHRRDISRIFFHMCPEYVVSLHILPKILRKRSILWYVHKRISIYLRAAHLLVNRIVTATESSCNLSSRKILVCGHGINTERFSPGTLPKTNTLEIVLVGRISPVKRYELLLPVAVALRSKNRHFHMRIAGPIAAQDVDYYNNLQQTIKNDHLSEYIEFVGVIPHEKLPMFYHSSHALISFTPTGSFDKVILEAMSSGLHVYCTNVSLEGILNEGYIKEGTTNTLAQLLAEVPLEHNYRNRNYIVQYHNLHELIKRLLSA